MTTEQKEILRSLSRSSTFYEETSRMSGITLGIWDLLGSKQTLEAKRYLGSLYTTLSRQLITDLHILSGDPNSPKMNVFHLVDNFEVWFRVKINDFWSPDKKYDASLAHDKKKYFSDAFASWKGVRNEHTSHINGCIEEEVLINRKIVSEFLDFTQNVLLQMNMVAGTEKHDYGYSYSYRDVTNHENQAKEDIIRNLKWETSK